MARFGLLLIVFGLQRPDGEQVGGEVQPVDPQAGDVDEAPRQQRSEPADTGQTTILWIGIVVSIAAVAGFVWLLRSLLPREEPEMPPVIPRHRGESEGAGNEPPPRP